MPRHLFSSLTKRAPDWWDASGQKERIQLLGIPRSLDLDRARPPAGNAFRCPRTGLSLYWRQIPTCTISVYERLVIQYI
jgi:hypothetical protein